MQSSSRSLAWILWSLVSFFYAYQYVLRVCPSVFIDPIMEKFSLTAGDYGTFSGIYYLGYALFHIPIALLLDRSNPRWIIPSFILLSVLGFLPLILFDHWSLSVAGRFLVGIGSSAAILSVFKIIRMNFEDKKFARILGFSVTIGLIGALYGSNPVSRLSQIIGWENVIWLFIGIGFVLAGVTFILIPQKSSQELMSETSPSLWKDLKQILTNKYVFLTALFAALMVGPLEGFADVWAATYFEHVYGFDKNTATTLPSLIFFGMCFGSPVLAYIAEKTQAYDRIIQLSALSMAAALVIILNWRFSPWGVGALCGLIGIFCAYQVLIMYMNSQNAPARFSSTVMSMTNMIIMTFGYVFHFIIGHVMDWAWKGQMKNGVRLYDAEAYTLGLSAVVGGLILAFIGFMLLNGYKNKALKPLRVNS